MDVCKGSVKGDQNQARAVLGFPEGRFLAYLLSVGYPSDKPLASSSG